MSGIAQRVRPNNLSYATLASRKHPNPPSKELLHVRIEQTGLSQVDDERPNYMHHKCHDRVHSDSEVHNKVEDDGVRLNWQLLTPELERRLAPDGYTARKHRPRTQFVLCFLMTGDDHWMVSDACGLKGGSDRKCDEVVFLNCNRQRRDRSCKDSQELGRSQDGACRLEPEKEAYAVAWNVMQTCDTGMWAYGRARTRVSRSTQVLSLYKIFICVSKYEDERQPSTEPPRAHKVGPSEEWRARTQTRDVNARYPPADVSPGN